MQNKIEYCKICKSKISTPILITNFIYGDKTKRKKFFKCSFCDVIFQKPFFKKKEEEKFYKKEFEKFMSSRAGKDAGWLNVNKHIKANDITFRRRYKFLKKHLKKGNKILEIGCSSGFMLFPLIKKNMKCYGVEPSNVFYKFLKEKRINVFKNLTHLKRNIKNVKFDLIMHFFVFEHMANPKKFILDKLKLLKKGGSILFEVPSYSDALYSLYKIKSFKKFYFSVVHPWYFNMKSISILLKSLNLKYNIKYHQRYSIDNHLTWLTEGRPGGSKYLEQLFDKKFNSTYKNKLERSGYADTLFVEIIK